MIKFSSPEFEKSFLSALKIYKDRIDDDVADFFSLFYDPTDEDAEPDEADVQEICPESTIQISFRYTHESVGSTYKRVVRDLLDLPAAKLIAEEEAIAPSRYLMRVECAEYPMPSWLHQAADEPIFSTTLESGTTRASVFLTCGVTLFSYLVAAEGLGDKQLPEILDGEYFVEVEFDGNGSLEQGRQLAEAFLFEMSASQGIDFRPSPRPKLIDELEESKCSSVEKRPIRPLLYGKGMADLIALYNAAVRSWDEMYAILSFTKVLEYVSSTVAQNAIVERLRSRLSSPRALQPDANFLLEVHKVSLLFAKQQRTDRECIKLTISTCVDALELASLRPKCAPELGKLSLDSSSKELDAAIDLFSERVVSTRNSIAHAKVNYEATGAEVAPGDYGDFVACLRLLAQHAIRWYASREEGMRVI